MAEMGEEKKADSHGGRKNARSDRLMMIQTLVDWNPRLLEDCGISEMSVES
jgi:hypothetical protein